MATGTENWAEILASGLQATLGGSCKFLPTKEALPDVINSRDISSHSPKVLVQSVRNFDLLKQHNKFVVPFNMEETERRERAEKKLTSGSVFVKSLHGQTMMFYVDPAYLLLEDLKSMVFDKDGIPPEQQRIIYDGKQLEDGRTLGEYEIVPGSTLYLALRLLGGGCSHITFQLDPSSLAPEFDYDFTHIDDYGKSFVRGGHTYKRPCGWKRLALNVSGKFDGGDDTWLGKKNSVGEWPVSYHGTGRHHACNIAQEGYKLSLGRRFMYGRGVYSTPDVSVAERYAQEFTHTDGSRYKMVLQNRVNPKALDKISAKVTGVGEYWISPRDRDLRPYGVLLKKVGSQKRARGS